MWRREGLTTVEVWGGCKKSCYWDCGKSRKRLPYSLSNEIEHWPQAVLSSQDDWKKVCGILVGARRKPIIVCWHRIGDLLQVWCLLLSARCLKPLGFFSTPDRERSLLSRFIFALAFPSMHRKRKEKYHHKRVSSSYKFFPRAVRAGSLPFLLFPIYVWINVIFYLQQTFDYPWTLYLLWRLTMARFIKK